MGIQLDFSGWLLSCSARRLKIHLPLLISSLSSFPCTTFSQASGSASSLSLLARPSLLPVLHVTDPEALNS